MLEVDVDQRELKVLSGKLRRLPGRMRKEQEQVFRINAFLLRDAVRRYASGRPGPRRITSTYVDSIQVTRHRSLFDGTSISVETDEPRARRLEQGFIGQDSEGRIYHQPPYPHWGPAIEEITPLLLRDSADTFRLGWEEG